jgi:hypothetical protein
MKLQTTIITSPNETLSLQKESRLLKSAILYSDNITLVSPNLTSVLYTIAIASLDEKSKVDFLKNLEHVLKNGSGERLEEFIKVRDALKNKRMKTKDDILKLKRIENELKKGDLYFQEWGENMYNQSGLEEFNF